MTREEAILHMTLRREELKQSVSDLDEDIKAFDMAIKALEQEPRWIPVSERLPEDGEECLCCFDYSYMTYVTIGTYYDNTQIWWLQDGSTTRKVVAWMPLPPCYEPQESEGKG